MDTSRRGRDHRQWEGGDTHGIDGTMGVNGGLVGTTDPAASGPELPSPNLRVLF
jgi:hypothetical protein